MGGGGGGGRGEMREGKREKGRKRKREESNLYFHQKHFPIIFSPFITKGQFIITL